MAKAKRATISDIAEKSGYSKTAVSFAFNCPHRISASARDRILEIAKELDYIPDPMARNFSLGRHMSIGFLLPQALESSLDNPFTQQIIMGMGEICNEHGYVITLIPPYKSSIPDAIKNATVDGIIAMGIFFDPVITEVMRRRSLPAVAIDGTGQDSAVNVTIDDEQAAFDQMKAVLECGHRNISIVSLPDDAYAAVTPEKVSTTAERRMNGYIRALSEYSIDIDSVAIAKCDTTLKAGKETALDLMASSSPTCFVCMSDIVAMGVRSAIIEKGFNCPDDISVIGFDGIINPELTGVDLTTIIQDPREKGRKAAELAFALIRGEEPEQKHLVSYSFHNGETLKNL